MVETTAGLQFCPATVIQEAINASAATGLPVYVAPGIYQATVPVMLRSDLTLIFQPGAILRREFSGPFATLTQTDWTIKLVNVKLSGGLIDNPQYNVGPQISIYGDHVSISGMEVFDFYSGDYKEKTIGGVGITIVGNDNSLSNLRVVTSCQTVGAGGIRMAGGNNFLCSNCYVTSGDDALQFVPIAPDLGNPNENVSISDSQYVNCIANSAAARACVVFLENRSDTDSMTANVTNCAFIGIRGQGGSVGALCSNKALGSQTSSGYISNIQFIGVSLSLGSAANGPTFQVQRDSPSGGPIQQIDFIGCTAFDGGAGSGLYVEQASRVRWIGGSIAAGPLSSLVVQIFSSTDCEVRDATVICSGAGSGTGVYVGSANTTLAPTDRIRISGVSIIDIADGWIGLLLRGANSCVVASNTFLRAPSTANAGAIYVDDSYNCVLDQNNTLSVDTPYSLTSGSGYIDSALGIATSATGTVTLSSLSGTADVTFAVPFLNDRYSVQLTGNVTGETFAFSNQSTSGFTVSSSNTSSTAEVCWTALIVGFSIPSHLKPT
jgi:hypothetical protein